MNTGALIDYKALRKVNPEAARLAVLEYLQSCQHNVAATARVFGITRPVVYERTADRINAEVLEPLQVKGRATPVQAYRVLGLKDPA